jgi:hypothetical protein
VKINEYLDAAKAALRCRTDSELALRLRVQPGRISNYRTGRPDGAADCHHSQHTLGHRYQRHTQGKSAPRSVRESPHSLGVNSKSVEAVQQVD